MDRESYFHTLYPFQDAVLAAIAGLETEFYLTGGTAASRGYLGHRFSEDLDLFVSDDARFGLWSERLIEGLGARPGWRIEVTLREARFVRFSVIAHIPLKIELVNDVPSHLGEIVKHPVLGRLDSAENILANKITALADRQEPKDLADIWGFCCGRGMPIAGALEGAHSKAAGLFPVDLARILLSVGRADWEVVRWIDAPEPERFVNDLRRLGEELLLINPDGTP